jgi:hypothetical protein
MRKKILFLLFTICSIILQPKIFSQVNFSVHVGAALPIFDFGKITIDENENNELAGGAGVGIDLGVKFLYPITKDGISVFAEADIIRNGLKSDFKNDMQASINRSYGAGSEIKYIAYYNMPILAGANFEFFSKKDFDFSAELGMGIDFFKISSLKIESGEIKYKEKYDITGKLAIKAGFDICYKKKYSLGINYLILGKHPIKGQQIMLGTGLDFENGVQDVSLLTFTLGYSF